MDRIIKHPDGRNQFRHGIIKAQTLNTDGYYTVHLNKDAITKTITVHILVANAFVDGKFDGAEVNHIDSNRTNNRPENLEWITHRDNVYHAINRGVMYYQKSDMNGENNPNYGNHKLSQRYAEDKAYALEKQSRPGSQNGRAKPVTMVLPDGTSMSFGYYRECARYLMENGILYSSSVTALSNQISQAVKTGDSYHGITFKSI